MRVAVPAVPPHAAETGTLLTVKTVLLLPVVSPLTLPSKVMVSVMVSPALLPAVPATVERAVAGTVLPSVGATVSSVKLLAPAALALPAASVAMALTLMLPLPSAVMSDALSATVTAVAPLPVMDLTTEPLGPVKVTWVAELNSAATVTTPAAASVLVAPLLTPVPRVTVGAAGAVVSMIGSAALSMSAMLVA